MSGKLLCRTQFNQSCAVSPSNKAMKIVKLINRTFFSKSGKLVNFTMRSGCVHRSKIKFVFLSTTNYQSPERMGWEGVGQIWIGSFTSETIPAKTSSCFHWSATGKSDETWKRFCVLLLTAWLIRPLFQTSSEQFNSYWRTPPYNLKSRLKLCPAISCAVALHVWWEDPMEICLETA